MDERESLVWLSLCARLTPNRRRALIRCKGSARKAVSFLQAMGEQVDYSLVAQALRADHVTPADALYPACLRDLSEPPELLYYRGDLAGLAETRPTVSIVGTRRASSQGLHLASRFASAFALAGVRVVSGLAQGIDSAAHWASLEGPRPFPIAVVACGLNFGYPSENAQLLRRIEEKGIALSEYGPNTPVRPYHFGERNRLLAALGQALLVVEAPARSGVQLTVTHAQELSREIYVLPGPVDHPNYQGSLALIAEGAHLARHPHDVLLGLGVTVLPEVPGSGPALPEEWARRLQLPLPDTLRQLSQWERTGQMRRDRRGYYGWAAGVGVPVGLKTSGIGGRPVGSKGRFSN